MAYSDPPERNMVRLIVTSAYSIGSAPSELSMVSSTSARPSGERPDVPAKMTSSILPPRRLLAPCSPITQASASTTLDLPEPLGPTMQVMPGSSWSVVEEAKDLNPFRVRLFRYNACSSCPAIGPPRGRWRARASSQTPYPGKAARPAYGERLPRSATREACRGAAGNVAPMSEQPRAHNFQISVPDSVSAGVWANFATVSHSPYEFTIDFVRLDFAHPTGDGGRQGQVVARVNLSPLMVTQLMEALEGNWQKYAARALPTDLEGPEAGLTRPGLQNGRVSPVLLFRRVAVAEAVTWALLLGGMFLKYVTDTTELGVRVFGMVHGVVFVAYCLVTLLVAVDQRWSPSRTALGLACAVPPFLTVWFDRYAEARGALGSCGGSPTRRWPPAGPNGSSARWCATRSWACSAASSPWRC